MDSQASMQGASQPVHHAGWMDGWVDGWVDGWMDGWIVDRTQPIFIVFLSHN